jgi:uncharacterized caspase-like protein
MKSALEVAGYLVELYLDLDRIGMKTVLKKLRERATNGCIVLVYYSGHGHSIHGEDFLMPIGLKKKTAPTTIKGMTDKAIHMSWVWAYMAQTPAKYKVLITDACRMREGDDAIASRNIKASLADLNQSDRGANSFFIQSSSDATVSLDGTKDGLSLMTKHLVPLLAEKGLELGELVKQLSREVLDATSSAPDGSGRMLVNPSAQAWVDDFYFVLP